MFVLTSWLLFSFPWICQCPFLHVFLSSEAFNRIAACSITTEWCVCAFLFIYSNVLVTSLFLKLIYTLYPWDIWRDERFHVFLYSFFLLSAILLAFSLKQQPFGKSYWQKACTNKTLYDVKSNERGRERDGERKEIIKFFI